MRIIKNNKSLKLILTLLAVITVPSVSASSLKGVKEIGIVVETPESEDLRCGITKSILDAAVRVPLSNSRLVVTERLTRGYIYVNVNSLDLGLQNFCAVRIGLSFNKFITSESQTGRFVNYGTMLVWNKNDMASKASSVLDGFTKEFLAEWLKANSN